MDYSGNEVQRYPLLEAILAQKGLKLKGTYKNRDAAQVFDVSIRTIQEWCRDGKLRVRKLPGHVRFLAGDLEALLEGSTTAKEGS